MCNIVCVICQLPRKQTLSLWIIYEWEVKNEGYTPFLQDEKPVYP